MLVEFASLFSEYRIQTIAYAGANVGATALALDDAFQGLELYLLEPVPEVFEVLVGNVGDRRNMHCLNVAAGAEDGWYEMFVDSHSTASSLLPLEPVALEEHPYLGKQTRARVRVRPLDDVLTECGSGRIDMLIMDVEGYENEVIRGARRTLDSCRLVMSELNVQPIHAGSSTLDSVYPALVREGFQLAYILNPKIGESQRILQVDGVFVRESRTSL
ncbi:MAG: FkbM family methyltransferase [bacterium]